MALKKKGGNPTPQTYDDAFREVLFIYNLAEVQMVRNLFTWWNAQLGKGNIEVRLDRFVASPSWREMFREAEV